MDTLYLRIPLHPHSSVPGRHMCLIWLFPMMLKLSEVHIYPAGCHTGMNTGVCLQAYITFYLDECCALYLKNILCVFVPMQSGFSSFHSFLCLKHMKNPPCSIRKELKVHNSSLYPKSFKGCIWRRVLHL